jgi:hypothetical protein
MIASVVRQPLILPMDEFLDAMERDLYGATPQGCCINCKEVFSKENTRTPQGWRETQISGFCEDCYDEIFSEE